MVDRSSSLPVRSHSGIDTFCLPWRRRAEDTAVNVSCSESELCVHKQSSQCSCSCVETLVILQAFMLYRAFLVFLKWRLKKSAPCTPLKISLPENKNTVDLKSASLVVIMLLHAGLTHIHSQIKPRLHVGESFTLKKLFWWFPPKQKSRHTALRGTNMTNSSHLK